MKCESCGNLIDRKVARENAGLCDTCVNEQTESRKIANDLLTSFGGKGKRGFVQWLKMGRFLQVITDEAEVNWYNDRIAVVEKMVGGNIDRLLEIFAGTVLEIAKEESETND